ncbi:MAG: hypothetical protein JSU94_21310 [Phycisphaerales bacterium]|nr:MAG: hypothetical protein JSU94_21310 [Phycisphaerales bacterium]
MADTSSNLKTARKPRTIGGFLASAMDMEDNLHRSIYQDYLDRSNWPKSLPDDAFEQIRRRLDVLIRDTERHKEILRAFIEKYGDGGKSG